MGKRFSTILMISAALVLQAGIAVAQDVTGTLMGTVRDGQGGVLRGATVRVNSTALIGGPQAVTTNELGRLRFPALPPGSYTLDVEASGFGPYHEENIRIGVGATIERTVVLKLASIAESLVVQGAIVALAVLTFFALALATSAPERPALPGVATRIVLAWAFGTGLAVLGAGLVAAGFLLGGPGSADRLAATADPAFARDGRKAAARKAPASATTAATVAALVIASTKAWLATVIRWAPACPPTSAATWWAAPTLSLAASAAPCGRFAVSPSMPAL